MEALLLIAVGVVITYFFMNSQHSAQEARTPAEESDDFSKFVHYKKRILGTSADSESSTYEVLHEKVARLTEVLLAKHSARLMPTAAVKEIESNFDQYFEDRHGGWWIKRALRIEDLPNEILLVLAVLCFNGGKSHAGLQISRNRFFTNRVIEYLIHKREYWNAMLAKALIMKYGFQEDLAPQTDEARKLFTRIASHDTEIYEELSGLAPLHALEVMKSKHYHHVSHTWRTHEVLEELVSQYHPDNING